MQRTSKLAQPIPRPADREWRDEQRSAVQQVHADVYAQLTDPALRALSAGSGTGP